MVKDNFVHNEIRKLCEFLERRSVDILLEKSAPGKESDTFSQKESADVEKIISKVIEIKNQSLKLKQDKDKS